MPQPPDTMTKTFQEYKNFIKPLKEDKFNLTDYQVKCIAFAKGFIIGAILL